MKQLVTIFTAILFFATGYLVGNQQVSQSDLISIQESRFVSYSQQAHYKLAALKNIRKGATDEAIGVLEASLVVDESEMSVCGLETSECDRKFKTAFKEFKSKKTDYEKSASKQ